MPGTMKALIDQVYDHMIACDSLDLRDLRIVSIRECTLGKYNLNVCDHFYAIKHELCVIVTFIA